jgi:hypothetical protein
MIRLISMELTNSQYVINHKNRYIDFLDSGVLPVPPATCHVAPLSVGTYTSTTLANEINTQLNTAVGVGFGVNYSVAYSSTTQKFTITRLGGPTTQFLFKTGPHGSDGLNQSCAAVIGFVPTLDTVTATALTSPNLVNLAGENSVYMVMKGYPAIVTGGAIQDAFAKIILNVVPRNVVFNSFAANSLIFTNPVDVIDNFEVKIVEQSGSLYDFFNVDYSFAIEAFCE